MKLIEAPLPILPLVILLLVGFLILSGAIPFYFATTKMLESTTPVVATIFTTLFIPIVSLYCILRMLFFVFGFDNITAWILFFIGSGLIFYWLLALRKLTVRNLLAHLSISQIGFMLIGIATRNEFGIIGALIHVLSYSFTRGILFLNLANCETFGNKRVDELLGLKYSAPVTGNTNILAIMGEFVPPFLGFWGKLFILFGLIFANKPVIFGLVLLNMGLTLWAYFRVYGKLIFNRTYEKFFEPGIFIFVVVGLTTLFILGGLYPVLDTKLSIFKFIVGSFFTPETYIKAIIGL